MRRGRLAATLAVATCAGLGLLAPPAGAAPSAARVLLQEEAGHAPTPASQPFVQPTIPLGKQGGYSVEAFGRGDRVFVLLLKGERLGALYAAPGIATSTRLEASFGKFGEISMRFRVSTDRSWQRPHRKCRGKQRYVNRRGTFAGRLRFRGEGGYFGVRIHRAKGYVTAVAPSCERTGGGGQLPLSATGDGDPPGPVPAGLRLTWLDGVSALAFRAAGRSQGTWFSAESAETVGRVGIFRYAAATGGPGRLRVDEALTVARVNPPAPFSGSGTYRAAPDGTVSWSGSLSVDFPGAPRTPLGAEPFRAQLSGGI